MSILLFRFLTIQSYRLHYLKHWLTKLKEEPAFLVEILGDVNKAAKMIADKVTEPMNEPAAA